MAMKYDPIMCMMVPDTVSIKDSAVNEYEIHYTVPGKSGEMVGSGRGSTEAEAKADFLSYHKSENPKITSVKFYKKVSDEKAIDKAITTCDKTELDPQDSRYIRKAIGNLKIASSLLGMINEGTVNKAKQNIANTISLLESID